MDSIPPKSRPYRFRINTLLLLVVIAALAVQLYLQAARLQQSRAKEEAARAELSRANAALAEALQRAQAQMAQGSQTTSATASPSNSGIATKSKP